MSDVLSFEMTCCIEFSLSCLEAFGFISSGLVGEPNGACRVRLGGDQSQRRSACVLKELLALAQDQRTDDERILIDEVMVHERVDKVATTQDHYVLTKLLLEFGHFFGDIALDQPGIVPCHLLQGG